MALKYWYKASNGSDNWATASNWYAGTGGTGGTVAVPTSSDTAIFDGNSGTGTITIAAGATAGAIVCDGSQGTAGTAFKGTFAGASTIACSGSFLFPATTATFSYTGTITFSGSGTLTVPTAITTSAGWSVSTSGAVTITVGATFTLGTGTLTIGGSGALSSAGYSITAATFALSGGSWNMGSGGTFTASGTGTCWNNTACTISNATGTTITISNASSTGKTFAGNGQSYGTVQYVVASSSGALTISGSNTFVNLNFTTNGTARTLTITAGTTQTVTGTFTLTGASGSVATCSASSNANIIAATTSITYATFSYITASGAGTWIATASSQTNSVGITTPRYYYVAANGSSTWATAGAWFNASGGTGGAAPAVPTLADLAIFDSNSGTGTCTIGASANCAGLIMDGVSWGTGAFAGTLAGSSQLSVYGNFLLSGSGSVTYTGAIILASTSASASINSRARSLGSSLQFNGTGTYTLAGALTTTAQIGFTVGNFNNGGYAVTCANVVISNNANARTLTFTGTVSWTITGSGWTATGATNVTLTFPSTLTINVTSTSATSFVDNTAGMTYGCTFNFTGCTGTVTITPGTSTVFNAFGYLPGSAATCLLTIGGSFTVTTTCTVTGHAAPNRCLVQSSVWGTPRTITCNGSYAFTYCDLLDMTAGGTASRTFSATDGSAVGNCGSNTNWTFTGGLTSYYKGGGTGNWSAANWYSATNGGGSAQRVPIPQDTAIFDSNSGNYNYTNDLRRLGNVDLHLYTTGTITWNSATPVSIFGSFVDGTHTHAGTAVITLASRGTGVAFTPASSVTATYSITHQSVGTAGYTMTTNGFTTSGTFTVAAGTFNTGGLAMTSSSLTQTGGTLTCGSSVWTLTGASVTAINYTGGTMSAASASFVAAGTTLNWVLGSNSYGAITMQGAGTQAVSGAATIGTLTATNFNAVTVANNLSVGTMSLTSPSTFSGTLTLTAGITVTVTSSLTLTGTAAWPLIINSSSSGSPATISAAASVPVLARNCSIKDSTPAGGAVFRAYNSTLVSDTTGTGGWYPATDLLAAVMI